MVEQSEIVDAFGYFARVRLQNGPTPEEMAATVEAWEVTFDDVSGQEFQEAALKWGRSSKWWPTPAEIREFIPRLKLGNLALEVADPETGRDRWAEVLKWAGSVGNRAGWLEKLGEWTGIKDLARLEVAIRDCGGWRHILNMNHDAARHQTGKRFAASWDRYARASAQGLLPKGAERALVDDGEPLDPPINLMAEIARRKALGAPRG